MADVMKSAASAVFLPGPGSSLERDLMIKLNLTARPFPTSLRLGDISRAMHLLSQILEALLPLAEVNLDGFSAAGIVQDFTAALKLAGRILKHLLSLTRRSEMTTRRNIIDSVVRYIHFANILMRRSLKCKNMGYLDAQASRLLSETLAMIISNTGLTNDTEVEQALQLSLECLKHCQVVSPATKINIQSVLIPRLVDFLTRNDSLSVSLQVSCSLCMKQTSSYLQ